MKKKLDTDQIDANLKWLKEQCQQGIKAYSKFVFINKLVVRNITIQGRPQIINFSQVREKNVTNFNLTFFSV